MGIMGSDERVDLSLLAIYDFNLKWAPGVIFNYSRSTSGLELASEKLNQANVGP